MKPRKGLKLKERYFSIETPPELNNITLFRYAGTFFGLWNIDGCFILVDNIFIDSGNPNYSRKDMLEYVRTLDKNRDWIILNTHMHEDHVGGNRLIQNELGAEIYSPESVEDFSFVSLMMDLFWGRPEMFTYKMLDRNVFTTDMGRTIEVIPAPGHSPNHTVYRIMPDNIIYSGDAIPVPSRKRYVTLGENYMSELDSLKKLLPYAEKGTRFISAHHGIVKDSVKLIKERISGMTDVVSGVEELVSRGITDKAEIGMEVFGKQDLLYRKLGNQIRCREDWAIESILEGLGCGLEIQAEKCN
ncbi:MAG TPA: MBL fold metallo-hydrolase [Spirochaetota bacterium]|nr:MBL fold metallo-hydrolase [Spirochaetota bacterium]HPJ33637.1 MBL fold metallo-hydrolase [Spirochaetota bacterium]